MDALGPLDKQRMITMELYEIKQHQKAFKTRLEDIETLLDIEGLKKTISTLEEKTYDNQFWDDHKKANETIQKLKRLKQRVKFYEQLQSKLDDIDVAIELIEMGESEEDAASLIEETQRAFTKLETMLFLSESYDALNAIVEIHPGAGGTESQDWAMMLYRMYKRYAEKKGFTMVVNDYLDGGEAGLKSATINIKGEYAYGLLKAEGGVHRLVRLSPFDSSGRRHTSFASVNVVPEIDESIEVEVSDTDLKIDTFRSSGAGGQSVNTTDSAVRITHKPTNIVVSCQNERSQIQNREQALKILKGKLYAREIERQRQKLAKIKGDDMSNAFGSQIRSTVMHPYNMVKDHRTGAETAHVEAVMDGALDEFINAYLKWMMGKGDSSA